MRLDQRAVGDAFSSSDALVIIDPQIDFGPGGRPAVARGDEIMTEIVDLAGRFQHVVVTQD